MTLVVTEVSEKYGCVVVGDTAVTIRNSAKARVTLGARKVHHAADANIDSQSGGTPALEAND